MNDLEWKPLPNIECSQCGQGLLVLNQFGVCAECWGNWSADKRAAQMGEQVKIVPQMVYQPVPRMRAVIAISAVIGAAFSAAVMLAWIWWRTR